jgi:tetratricopeptide (TPR) repeat protein
MQPFMPFLLGFISMFISAHADDAIEDSLAPSETSAAAEVNDDEQATPARRLNDALHLYQRGNASMAQRALARFINDPAMADETLRQRARVYLGEVLYQQQNEEEARRIFEAVLTLDPNYTIDPFAHPPDVCGFFETVRAYIVPMGPTVAQAPPDPLPSSAYVGFGVYHFQAGDPRSGARIAIAQTTVGLISLVTFAGLLDDRKYATGQGTLEALNLRRGIQWSATAAFYGIWAWSITDSKRHWRANVGIESPRGRNDGSDSGGMPGLHLGLTFPTH